MGGCGERAANRRGETRRGDETRRRKGTVGVARPCLIGVLRVGRRPQLQERHVAMGMDR
jgi:hypothetical protein